MRFAFISVLLLASMVTSGQSRKDWTKLDYLNSDSQFPYKPEKDISAVCFVVPRDLYSFYAKPLVVKADNNTVILKIEFSELKGLSTTYKGKTYKQFDPSNPFQPWLFGDNPDYFQLAFECVDSSGGHYKIKLSDNEFALLSKQNRDFKTQSVSEFVKEWTSLGLDFDRTITPLYESPDIHGRLIRHPEEKLYKIWSGESLKVQGDWIKIKTIKNEIGWLKWRNGTKVYIKMYFAC